MSTVGVSTKSEISSDFTAFSTSLNQKDCRTTHPFEVNSEPKHGGKPDAEKPGLSGDSLLSMFQGEQTAPH
jgi:hypothetical protein